MPFPHRPSRAQPLPAVAFARLSCRVGRPAPAPAWTPPPLPELIARIDRALAARRAD